MAREVDRKFANVVDDWNGFNVQELKSELTCGPIGDTCIDPSEFSVVKTPSMTIDITLSKCSSALPAEMNGGKALVRNPTRKRGMTNGPSLTHRVKI